ncbi:MAG: hypothetical protein ACLFMX_01265 [Halobacteriales archaeon]
MSVVEVAVDRLRKPEHTGANRCMPCTVVNGVIAVVLAGIIALAWLPVGVVSLGLFAGAIYLRGYLVPGTPHLTRTYLPEWFLQLFGKEPVDVEISPAPGSDRDVDELLLEASVVEPCRSEDDLCLVEEFERAWWQSIKRLRGDRDLAERRLGEILDLERDEFELDAVEGGVVLRSEDQTIGEWPSDGAFLADLALEPLLADRFPAWDDLDPRLRTQSLAGLRVFLDRCPACESELEHVESVHESCCGSTIVGVAIECPDCEAQLFNGTVR